MSFWMLLRAWISSNSVLLPGNSVLLLKGGKSKSILFKKKTKNVVYWILILNAFYCGHIYNKLEIDCLCTRSNLIVFLMLRLILIDILSSTNAYGHDKTTVLCHGYVLTVKLNDRKKSIGKMCASHLPHSLRILKICKLYSINKKNEAIILRESE